MSLQPTMHEINGTRDQMQVVPCGGGEAGRHTDVRRSQKMNCRSVVCNASLLGVWKPHLTLVVHVATLCVLILGELNIK